MRQIPTRIGFPANVYPRGPQWRSNEEVRPWIPWQWKTMPSKGRTLKKITRYEDILGFSQQRTPIWSNWMPGLGSLGDVMVDDYPHDLKALPDVGGIIRDVEAKGEKLEMALKAILVLSGIAAGTGVLNLLRRR